MTVCLKKLSRGKRASVIDFLQTTKGPWRRLVHVAKNRYRIQIVDIWTFIFCFGPVVKISDQWLSAKWAWCLDYDAVWPFFLLMPYFFLIFNLRKGLPLGWRLQIIMMIFFFFSCKSTYNLVGFIPTLMIALKHVFFYCQSLNETSTKKTLVCLLSRLMGRG